MDKARRKLRVIMDFLGHESMETTQVYVKANPEARKNALESISTIAESLHCQNGRMMPI